MKRFFRFCLLLCLPLIIMVLVYVVIDPFKVIWHYDVYYQADDIVGLNRGYVSAMHYANHQQQYKFDSFIFGNSRSIAYHCEEWKKYIPKSSVCYHFDVSWGSLGELFCEIKFINEHGSLKNALLVMDHDILFHTELDGILFSMAPILKKGKGMIGFQTEYFMAFYHIGFFRAYLDYQISKEYKPYMASELINSELRLDYNPITNELYWNKHEKMIEEGNYYNIDRVNGFKNAQFPGEAYNVLLNDKRKEMLKEIKSIFDAQKTNYRIVLSPIYDQKKINPEDLQFLIDVFGQDNVFDFSGINKWTADYQNYYDIGHYRSNVANEIMKIVYSDK